mmetsp:Transcript_48862/g.140261  ORF Transcript_48862/g.140261 Transcript_48862/m.140261 type:complete len:255 (-) Transcript_48862:504-1268(-)
MRHEPGIAPDNEQGDQQAHHHAQRQGETCAEACQGVAAPEPGRLAAQADEGALGGVLKLRACGEAQHQRGHSAGRECAGRRGVPNGPRSHDACRHHSGRKRHEFGGAVIQQLDGQRPPGVGHEHCQQAPMGECEDLAAVTGRGGLQCKVSDRAWPQSAAQKKSRNGQPRKHIQQCRERKGMRPGLLDVSPHSRGSVRRALLERHGAARLVWQVRHQCLPPHLLFTIAQGLQPQGRGGFAVACAREGSGEGPTAG